MLAARNKTMNKLFVYGTLAPGKPNEHVLAQLAGNWQEASVKGILYDQSWGAPPGCPGIVLGEHGDSVKGFIFSSEDLIDHWSRLDDFEGSAYQRVSTLAHLDDDGAIETQIYVLAQTPTE